MAGIADPSGFSFLTNLMNTVGGNATQSINAKKPAGLKTMAGTFGQFDAPPATVLPGGGTLDEGAQTQIAREEGPSAELPLFQDAQKNKIADAGVLGADANLGAQKDILGQQYRSQLMSMIGPMLQKLGIPTGGADLMSGGGDFLMKLMSGGI